MTLSQIPAGCAPTAGGPQAGLTQGTYVTYALYVSITASDARKRWADVFSQAVEARWPVPIERGGDERALLIGFDEMKLLLDPYTFSTEVFFEPEAVSIWLPELQLYGRGATFEDAQADLVEVIAYAEEFLADATCTSARRTAPPTSPGYSARTSRTPPES